MSACFPHAPASAPAPATVPAGTRSRTVWVWLIVGLPVLAGVVGIGAIAEMQRVFAMVFELWPTEYDAATADAFEAEILRLYFGLFFSPWVWGAFILAGADPRRPCGSGCSASANSEREVSCDHFTGAGRSWGRSST